MDHLAALISASGSIAQVVVAVVAVFLAKRANQINKESYLMTRIAGDLAGALQLARTTQRLHRETLRRFGTINDKKAARTKWLETNEEVAFLLRDLVALDPSLAQLSVHWQHVEEQDSHARNDKLECDDALRAEEQRKFDAAFTTFREAVCKATRRMRAE